MPNADLSPDEFAAAVAAVTTAFGDPTRRDIYLFVRARAEGAGMTCNVGIAERADRLIIALVGTGLTGEPVNVPYVQAIGLWALVAASPITVGQRLVTVYQQSRAMQ